MTTAIRTPRFNPLAAFVAGVLLIDVLALGGVVLRMWQGRLASDWLSFYAAGTLVRTGNASHLYDAASQAAVQHIVAGPDFKPVGFPLPVFAALAFAPLSRLGYAGSYTVWLAVNVALVVVLVCLSWRWLEALAVPLRTVVLACAVSVAALDVLMQGQIDLFVLAGFVGCYALLRTQRPFLGGAVLALALCKPHLAAAVVLLLLVKGQWRALAGFAAAGVPLLFGPTLILGPHLLADQVRLMLSYTGSSSDYQVAADMMINIRGTVTSLTGSSDVWLWLPLLGIIAATALTIAIRVWLERPALHPQSWALAFALPLLYSPHLHLQSIVLLIPAACLYLLESQSSDRPIADIKYPLFALVAITLLWSLTLVGASFMAFLIMGTYGWLAGRWPQPASAVVEEARAPELALAV